MEGSYPYAGTGFANPDAVTSIGGATFAYDNAGNQTTAGSNTFAWDWRNLLNTSVVGATSTTYNYDENGKRTRVNDGTTIFHYPNDLYQTDSVSGVPTKYIQLNGRDIAVITGATGSSTANYSFPDNQNSTNVVTDSTSNIQETQDYYPYGSARINTGSNVQQRKYIGEFGDASGLDYLNARYLSSDRGQFISQDRLLGGGPSTRLLLNPQGLNTYSYALDNPVNRSDPSGLITKEQQIQTLQLQVSALQGIVNLYQSGATGQANTAFAHYQSITGGSDFRNMMGSINTFSDQAQAYAQGSGFLNRTFNQLTKDNTAAYISGGIGLTAAGGAGGLYLGLEAAASTCVAFCDKASQEVPSGISETAAQIADHAIGHFPAGTSMDEASQVIEKTMLSPDSVRLLENGRVGFVNYQSGWNVIFNPNVPYSGTTFRPSDPLNYFNNVLH